MANSFDLNIPLQDEDNVFDLNIPLEDEDNVFDPDAPLEENNGFDLNIPLDEFGAVDSNYVQNLTEHVQQPRRNKEMTDHLRKQVFQTLLARSKNGKLGKKDTTIVAEQFGLKIRAVQKLWKRGKTQLANSIPVDVSSLKKGRVGRKQIPVDLDALRNIPLKQRMTIEDVCKALNLSKWQIQRFLKKGYLRRHSSSIKPYLTETNNRGRLQWCVDMVNRELLHDPKFKELYDFIFIDEKWFYLHQKNERYYLLPEEDVPHQTCKNKNYIPRLMFLCACARPRFRDGVCTFDGIHGVLATPCEPDVSNTTRCLHRSNESEWLQQLSDTSHEKRNTRK